MSSKESNGSNHGERLQENNRPNKQRSVYLLLAKKVPLTTYSDFND